MYTRSQLRAHQLPEDWKTAYVLTLDNVCRGLFISPRGKRFVLLEKDIGYLKKMMDRGPSVSHSAGRRETIKNGRRNDCVPNPQSSRLTKRRKRKKQRKLLRSVLIQNHNKKLLFNQMRQYREELQARSEVLYEALLTP